MRDKLLYSIALISGYSVERPTTVLGLDNNGYHGLKSLQFKADGTFKIGIFEDLHFGEGEDNRKSGLPVIVDERNMDMGIFLV